MNIKRKKGAGQSVPSNVIPFDEDKLNYTLPNDPEQEFFFNILEGLSYVAQKRRLMEGYQAGCLSRQNCTVLMSALGLEGV